MPYKIEERDGKFCVVKKTDGSVIHCHDSEEKAGAQMRALYANENLSAHLDSLAKAILSLTIQELGEGAGHPYRGNQYGPGESEGEVSGFRGEKSGIPKGSDVVLRKNTASDNWDVVSGHKDVLGTVTQTGGFGAGFQDDFEAVPVVGEPKEFHTVNEAVKHILKETEDLHKMPIAASMHVELGGDGSGDKEDHPFHGNQWTGGKGDGKEDDKKGDKKGDKEDHKVGSLSKKGMVVHGGDAVKIGDKVTVSDFVMGKREGRVKEISGQGVGVKVDGLTAIYDPDEVTKGHNGDEGHGEVSFLVDHDKKLTSDAAMFDALFDSGPAKVNASAHQEFGDVVGHEFHGNQYAKAAAEDLKKAGIDVTVKGDQVRVSDEGLTPVEHLEKTVDAAVILQEKGYKTILGRQGESSHVEVTGVTAAIVFANSPSLQERLDLAEASGEVPSISERMESLEAAVIALSIQELGDTEGHPFHGNQYTGGKGGGGGKEEIEGLPGSVQEWIDAHPKNPGEPDFMWQSRLVDGLPKQTASDLIFATREKYEPVGYLALGIDQWNNEHGLPPLPGDIPQTPCDLDQAAEIAAYFDKAPDQSGDPEVQAAYDDFKRQNAEMFDYLTKPESEGGMGVTVDFVRTANGNPYDSASEQATDLRDNHHINIESGLGGAHEGTMSVLEYNQFRAVHDTFGHAGQGVGFDRHGEYQTWLAHASMYTEPGQSAMSSEYHGVNSALWAGGKGTYVGTGKSILLPDKWTAPEWDKDALAASAYTNKLDEIVKGLGLDAEWAQRYSNMPWHEGATVTASAQERVIDLEAAVLALGFLALGDVTGHDFHGNQWTGGKGDGTKDHPIKTDSAEEAAWLISKGKFVELPPNKVSILMDELARYAREAKDAGYKAPNYNLCNITIPDSNLFCADNKGIARVDMPQLSGAPIAGTEADKLPRNQFGEVDASAAFRGKLAADGYSFKDENVPAAYLKATQNELNGAKVAGIMETLEAGRLPPGRVFVSSDNYVIDGHHRWAGNIGEDYDDAHPGDVNMDVTRIDAPISVVLDYAKKFAADFGIPQQSAAAGPIVVYSTISRLEAAVLALVSLELGDTEGHPFHGNQWTPGTGKGDDVLAHHLMDKGGDMLLVKPMESLIERVAKTGGITIHAVTGEEPTTGYIVATKEDTMIVKDKPFFEDRNAGVRAVESFLVDNAEQLSGDKMLGVWHDTEHGEVAFDVVEHVEDKDAAISLGVERDQQSIWDVENMVEIKTGGTGGREQAASNQAA